DVKAIQTEHRRIKVLTDEGRKFADIEIPYLVGDSRIENIQARTIRPDGSTVDFKGQVFDRTAIKAKKVKVHVKAFTLPGVLKGSILEYSYTIRFRQKAPDEVKNPENYIFTTTTATPSAHWFVQDDLFTRRARFTVRPFPGTSLHCVLRNI